MKKILTASLVAMMAVSAANADIASTDYVEDRTGSVEFTGTAAAGSADLTAAVVALDEAIKGVAGGELELGKDSVDTDQIVNGAVNNDKLAEGAAVANIGYTPENEANRVKTVEEYQAAIADGTSASKYTSVAVVESKLGVLTAGTAGLETAIGDVANMGDTFSDAGLDATDLISATVEVQGNVDALGTTVANNAAAATTAATNAETNAKAYTDEEIKKLDTVGEITTANQVIVAVSEKDGIISARSSAITGDYITNGTVVEDDLHADVKASLDLADSAIQVADFTDDSVSLVTTGLQNTASYITEKCNEANAVCSLVSRGGKLVWEKVSY